MLDFVYYPVAFILRCWHTAFGFVLGDASGPGWALAIVFLVFTLRAILLAPAIKQARAARRMQRFAPQLDAIRRKFEEDRQRQAAELRNFQREHGLNPLGGCLPLIFQLPVFLGLNHVLRSFAEHPHHANYVFGLADVRSYLAARLFGVHLGDAVVHTGLVGGSAAHHAAWTWGVAPVAIPLMIVAAVATHLTARISRQHTVTPLTRSSRLAGALALWVFPCGVLVFGGALPVGLLIYWVANNAWTLGQQRVVLGRLAEQERREARRRTPRRSPPPRVGQRPPRKNVNRG